MSQRPAYLRQLGAILGGYVRFRSFPCQVNGIGAAQMLQIDGTAARMPQIDNA